MARIAVLRQDGVPNWLTDPLPDIFLPPEACDCHVSAPGPETGRAVLVQTSRDLRAHEALLAGLARRRWSTRGVAMVGLITPDATLDQIGLQGVRGLRLAAQHLREQDALRQDLTDLIPRAAQRAWHIELDAPASMAAGLAAIIRTSPVPIVLTRFAGVDPTLGLDQPGLGEILELLAARRVWIKLAGMTRATHGIALLRVLAATAIDRLIWGSFWPLQELDDSLEMLHAAAGTTDDLEQVLCVNPARLYGFPEPFAATAL